MRADLHRGPEPPLHTKAGYIDADPLSPSRSRLPTGGGPYIFKCQATVIEEGPKRRPSRIHITLRGELVENLADGHVRRGLDQPENVITVRIELRAARLSLTASCSIAGLAHPVNPADRRRQPDPKLCRRPPRLAATERSINHSVTQILAVSSCHSPPPISTEHSHCSRDLGIYSELENHEPALGIWYKTLPRRVLRPHTGPPLAPA